MPQIRKTVRDAMLSVLSASGTGLNARIAALATSYGITAFSIDWTAGSKSFFFGYLDPESANLSQLEMQGVCCAIYTSDVSNTHDEKPRTFSGQVMAHLVFYIINRDGIELNDVESLGDAIEDAVISCFENPTANWPVAVTFTGQYQGSFGPIEFTGDGWQRVLPMQFIFEVSA